MEVSAETVKSLFENRSRAIWRCISFRVLLGTELVQEFRKIHSAEGPFIRFLDILFSIVQLCPMLSYDWTVIMVRLGLIEGFFCVPGKKTKHPDIL